MRPTKIIIAHGSHADKVERSAGAGNVPALGMNWGDYEIDDYAAGTVRLPVFDANGRKRGAIT